MSGKINPDHRGGALDPPRATLEAWSPGPWPPCRRREPGLALAGRSARTPAVPGGIPLIGRLQRSRLSSPACDVATSCVREMSPSCVIAKRERRDTCPCRDNMSSSRGDVTQECLISVQSCVDGSRKEGAGPGRGGAVRVCRVNVTLRCTIASLGRGIATLQRQVAGLARDKRASLASSRAGVATFLGDDARALLRHRPPAGRLLLISAPLAREAVLRLRGLRQRLPWGGYGWLPVAS
jgi:hypothetical protein